MYRSDVTSPVPVPEAATVAVLDPEHRFLGTAFSSSLSEIALRLISRERITVNASFFAQRIARAVAYRREVVRNSDAFRVVYSEADQLPGLIVDRYGDALVVQLLTQAMDRHRELILEGLRQVLQPTAIVLRHDGIVRRKEGLALGVKLLGDIADPVEIAMNGFRWMVDLCRGQKTGLFLDQRENYDAAARHARGRALDCFSSSGGFALHLAAVCESVEAVDASEAALARAQVNANRNGVTNVEFRVADVFEVLAQKAAGGARYGTVVLDPPAFAKSRSSVAKAISGYREINTRALRLLDPGGILMTCSCSQHVSEADFFAMLAQAGRDAGRTLRIRERRIQAADHPVLLTIPETLYLKCAIAETLP